MPPKKPGKPKGGKRGKIGPNSLSRTNRELIRKEEQQEYGQAMKMLGSGHIQVYCFDGKTRLGHIRGKMAKRVWVNAGDIVLLGLRDYQDEKADIIGKYSADEVRQLRKLGDLPEMTEGAEKKDDVEDVVQFVQAPARQNAVAEPSGDCDSLELPDIDEL